MSEVQKSAKSIFLASEWRSGGEAGALSSPRNLRKCPTKPNGRAFSFANNVVRLFNNNRQDLYKKCKVRLIALRP